MLLLTPATASNDGVSVFSVFCSDVAAKTMIWKQIGGSVTLVGERKRGDNDVDLYQSHTRQFAVQPSR